MIGRLIANIEGLSLTEDDKAFVLHPQLAGIIFFSRNFQETEQFKSLVLQIRHLRPELILAIDQEGGRVQRIKSPLSILPPLGNCAAIEDLNERKQWLQQHAWLMASEIHSLDIDLSFAPVLDLNHQSSDIIGNRSISDDPNTLIELAQSYLLGMKQAGMVATGKHFPGHGYVALDSHLELPHDQRELARIEQADLMIFNQLLSKLPMIMTAHIVYSAIEPKPVTFSSFWLEDYLKTQQGYQGIVISDDLNMQGATTYIPDPAEKALSALHAGCDLILNCNNRAASYQILDQMDSAQITPLPQQQASQLRTAKGWCWDVFENDSKRRKTQNQLQIQQNIKNH